MAVIFSITLIYIGFGQYCIIAYGDTLTTPLITDKLDANFIGWTIKFLFCFNLVFSFPLMLYPANITIENYLFSEWQKSLKRQWSKNLVRALIILGIVSFTIFLQQKVSQFLAIIGSLTCTPIAFILPSLFHLKACAVTPTQRVIDLTIFFLSCGILLFCTVLGIINW